MLKPYINIKNKISTLYIYIMLKLGLFSVDTFA